MKEPRYIDPKGRTWLKFTCSFRNELDDMSFCFDIWAINRQHADEQLSWLKQNAQIDGQIVGEVDR